MKTMAFALVIAGGVLFSGASVAHAHGGPPRYRGDHGRVHDDLAHREYHRQMDHARFHDYLDHRAYHRSRHPQYHHYRGGYHFHAPSYHRYGGSPYYRHSRPGGGFYFHFGR